MARDTPAKRARRRRNPAVAAPPPRAKGNRANVIRNLSLVARGRRYPISTVVESDTPWSEGMDQTGQVTLSLRDMDDRLLAVLGDEAFMLQDGVRCTINGTIYVVGAVEFDGNGRYTLTLEDEVSWRLKQFSSFRAASRGRVTRFGFIKSFVDEAQRRPLARMRAFIPELDDKQPIRKASRR